MVFQHFNLFPTSLFLKIALLAPIWVRKKSKVEAEEMAMQLLEKFEYLIKPINIRSIISGPAAKSCHCTLCVCSHELCYLMKPTSALDPEMIKEV